MSEGWQLPTFPPDAKRDPRGYSLRIAEGYPIGQDPLGWAMGVLCDADHEQLHGLEVDVGPELDHQLDALACDYVFTHPAGHPERLQWLESAHFVDVDLAQWAALGGSITFEVARLAAPVAGLLRIETIATYLRFTEGDETTLLVGTGSDGPITVTEPFPFPLTVGGQPLTWVWDLVEEMHASSSDTPQWAAGVSRAQAVPATAALRAPWRDSRYAWGSRWGDRQQYTIGGHAFVRLFVTLEHNQPERFTTLRVAGGLKGFAQLAGRRAAAVTNTTLRI